MQRDLGDVVPPVRRPPEREIGCDIRESGFQIGTVPRPVSISFIQHPRLQPSQRRLLSRRRAHCVLRFARNSPSSFHPGSRSSQSSSFRDKSCTGWQGFHSWQKLRSVQSEGWHDGGPTAGPGRSMRESSRRATAGPSRTSSARAAPRIGPTTSSTIASRSRS